MTKRVYYQDGAICCEAQVLECRPCKESYEVLTDATVIFPESGGQLSDTGYMDGARISYAREEGQDVWHVSDKPFRRGDMVKIKADIRPRIDHTQQHTGEHILSGLANKLYGAVNVGFHMAEDYATIDLDIPLTHAQIQDLQREANRAVQRNLPISYETVKGEDLEHIKLRKQAKGLKGDIRIVYIDGGDIDSCTCCGTHTAFTGEVGYIKITSHMNYKGGTRLWFACGMRAVVDSLKNQDIVDALAVRFSAKSEDVVSAVERQGEEIVSLKHQLRACTEKLQEYLSAELLAGAEKVGGVSLVVKLQSDASMNELKTLGEKLAARDDVLAVLFSDNGGSLIYQAARGGNVRLSMRELIKAVNAAAGGKGGGRDDFAQGSAPITHGSDISGAVEQIKSYCMAALKE